MRQWLVRPFTQTVSAFFKGYFQALRHPFLLILRLLINLAFASLLMLPLTLLFNQTLSRLPQSDRFLDGLDAAFLAELTTTAMGQLSLTKFYLPVLLIAFLLLSFYLTGGILSSLWREGLGMRAFFDACNDRFFPMIGVTLGGCVLAILLLMVPLYGLAHGSNFFYETAISAGSSVQTALSGLDKLYWSLFVLIFLFMGSMAWRIYDYARLMVCSPAAWFGTNPGVFASLWRAIRFAVQNHVATFLLWLSFGLMQFLIVWLYQLAKPQFPEAESLLLMELGLGQLFVFGRIFTSLASHCGNLSLLRTVTPGADQPQSDNVPPISPYVDDDEPLPSPSEQAQPLTSPATPVERVAWISEPSLEDKQPERVTWEPEPRVTDERPVLSEPPADVASDPNPEPEPIKKTAADEDFQASELPEPLPTPAPEPWQPPAEDQPPTEPRNETPFQV